MRYAAEVVGGFVTRVLVVPKGAELGDLIYIGPENTVGIGWTYEAGEFRAPDHIEQ